jgi:hypothetical protein
MLAVANANCIEAQAPAFEAEIRGVTAVQLIPASVVRNQRGWPLEVVFEEVSNCVPAANPPA